MSKPTRGGRDGPSQRQLRVGEVVRHVLSDIFLRGDLHEADIVTAHLTVSEVRVSPDMRNATVYVARLGGGDMKETLKALTRARGYLRHEVGRQLTTKFTPDLTFVTDTSFDVASHISEVLHRPEVARDLEPDTDEDEDDNGQA